MFTISLEEFVHNFEIVNISHIHQDYSYHFYSLQLRNATPQFFSFTIGPSIDFYITLEKSFQDKRTVLLEETLMGHLLPGQLRNNGY